MTSVDFSGACSQISGQSAVTFNSLRVDDVRRISVIRPLTAILALESEKPIS